MQVPRIHQAQRYINFLLLTTAVMFVSCSVDSAKKHLLVAEKLWTEEKYAASVIEFERAARKDPNGPVGERALYRMAMTQSLFLRDYGAAVRSLRAFINASDDEEMIMTAENEIGEILFAKQKSFADAAKHYRALLNKTDAELTKEKAAEYTYRVGKSFFHLWQFQDAIQTFTELIQNYPETTWAERAYYEIGLSYFTGGEQQLLTPPKKNVYEKAIEAYEEFISKFPKSELVVEAKLGIASCYEEIDQLDKALKVLGEIEKTHPSPRIVRLKILRIKERMGKRG